MYGKLLILCDELPGDYKYYKVKDKNFLVCDNIDSEDDSKRFFVCWDSIIPEDQSFIRRCKYYANLRTYPSPDFMLSQKETTDPKFGTIKGSIQEQSYYDMYNIILERLRVCQERGENVIDEALNSIVQYPYEANEKFLEDFSKLLNKKGIAMILPTYSNRTDEITSIYRAEMLAAWQEQNKFMGQDAAYAKALDGMMYDDFGEVYKKSIDEMMKIYSLDLFGNEEPSGPQL